MIERRAWIWCDGYGEGFAYRCQNTRNVTRPTLEEAQAAALAEGWEFYSDIQDPTLQGHFCPECVSVLDAVSRLESIVNGEQL